MVKYVDISSHTWHSQAGVDHLVIDIRRDPQTFNEKHPGKDWDEAYEAEAEQLAEALSSFLCNRTMQALARRLA